MSNIENIFNQDFNATIRVMKDEKGNILFAAKDVALVLDYADTDQAIRAHVDKEDVYYIRVLFSEMGNPSISWDSYGIHQ